VSEQTSDPIGDLIAGSTTAPGASSASEAAAAPSSSDAIDIESPRVESPRIESPRLVPESGVAAEAPKEVPKQAPQDAPKPAPNIEVGKTDAPRATGKIMIMSPSHDDTYHDEAYHGAAEAPSDRDGRTTGLFGKRRFAALAAVIVLATAAGALGGALATVGLGHFNGGDEAKTASAASAQNPGLEEAVARIDADLAALKKLGAAQAAKIGDRIDKVEKAEAEPAAKLAKLSEAVEKLHAVPPPAPAPVASVPAPKETTGSIQPAAAVPKPEIARLPTLENWLLRDVANGGALIEGRQGMFEVFAGDEVQGLGRVDAIRRQDGRWVVVTTKGLIVAR
jgi:hypothetical protein